MTKTITYYILLAGFWAGIFFVSAVPANAACGANQTEITIHALKPDKSPLSNARVAIHVQKNVSATLALGAEITSGRSKTNGQWVGCVTTSKGPFAANVYLHHADRGNITLWDNQLTSNAAGRSGTALFGQLRITFRNPDNQVLRKLPLSIFAHTRDASQRPILTGTTAVKTSLETGPRGQLEFLVGPGMYVLRVQGTYSRYPIILSERKVEAGAVTVIDERLPAIAVHVRDGTRAVVPRYPITVSLQTKNDAGRSAPGLALSKGARTDRFGRLIVYVPANTYVISTRGSFTQFIFRKYDISVTEKTVTPVLFRLSGMRILLRHPSGNIARRGSFTLHEQQTSPNGAPSIARTIATNRSIGKSGYRNFFVPAGTYIIHANAQRYEQIEVFHEQQTRIDIPRDVTYHPDDQFTLTTPLSNTRLTIRSGTPPKSIPKMKRPLRSTYRIRAAKHAAPYTVIFSLTNTEALGLGVHTSKVRIAEYQDAKRSWKIVGRYDAGRKHVSAVVSGNSQVTLVELQ